MKNSNKINLETVNREELNKLAKISIPNSQNSKYPQGFFGFFESKQGYNKLVAYGPEDKTLQLTWIHKEYLTK
jgi:hypothetical protein